MISSIADSVQDFNLESAVTSVFSDIDVKLQSREVEDYHGIDKFNNGS